MRYEELASVFASFRVYRPLFTPSAMARAARALMPIGPEGHAPLPFMLGWLSTFACNAACSFCNVQDFLGQKGPLLEGEPLAALADTVSIVAIGGGEPFARRDMLSVLRGLKHKNVKTLIITNGMLLAPDKIDALAEIDPDIVMFSVHGGPAWHDSVMKSEGAWNKTRRAIEALLRVRRTTRVIINCVIDENIDELRAVAEAGRELGVDAVRYTMLTFMTEAEVAASKDEGLIPASYIRPSPPAVDAARLVAEVSLLKRDFGAFVSVHPYLTEREMAGWFGESGGTTRGCAVMRHTLYLKPDGTAVPCPYLLDHPLGNVTEQPLEEIWNGHQMRALRLRRDREAFAVCARCCKT